MSAPFAAGAVRVGCTVTLRVSKDGREGTIEWLISRSRTRVDEGVLGRRTRLARALLGKRVGDILSPLEGGSPFWLRVEAIELPVRGYRGLQQEPAANFGLGGLSVRISYDTVNGPADQEEPEREPGTWDESGHREDGDL